MDILYLLIPLSVALVIPVGLAFWWALRGGQFDDLDGPVHRILMEEDERDEQDAPPPAGAFDLNQMPRPPRL